MADRTMEHLRTLSDRIGPKAFRLVAIGRIYGLPVVITSSRRDLTTQQIFLNLGASKTLDSRHLTGDAIDIDMLGHPPDTVPLEIWRWMGELGEALGLRWGGRWANLRDFRHFEMR